MQNNGTGAMDNKIETLKESVRNLVDAGGERAGQIKSKALDAKDVVVENGSAAIRQVSSLIKAHPFFAIGIALGVGYVAVRMLRK